MTKEDLLTLLQAIACQFLIGKVKRLLQNLMSSFQMRTVECQFLIGKVKPVSIEQLKDYGLAVKCQFLIGKVKHDMSIKEATVIAGLEGCQFLIGKVKPIKLTKPVLLKIVSIPHR